MDGAQPRHTFAAGTYYEKRLTSTQRRFLKAVEMLAGRGIDVESIDLRSIKPWDRDLIYSSVGKTGRLVIADAAWMSGGIAAEIAAAVAGEIFHTLKAPIVRVCLPDAPAPTSAALERAYYIGAGNIVAAVEKVLS